MAEVGERDRATAVVGPVAVPALREQGLLGAAVGVGLALLALPGPGWLLVGVAALQALLAVNLLELLAAPGRLGALLVASAATAAAGVLVLRGDGEVDGLAAVVALSLVAALLHQLVRRDGRPNVTASLADTLFVVVLLVSAGCLVALRAETSGRPVAVVALAAAAACLLAGRLGDLSAPGPRLHAGSSRSAAGLLLGLLAAVVVAALVALPGDLPVGRAVLLGLAVGAAAAAADLAVDLAAGELRATARRVRAGGEPTAPGTDESLPDTAPPVPRGVRPRRLAALRPVAALLPYAVVGPVALVGGRLVLG